MIGEDFVARMDDALFDDVSMLILIRAKVKAYVSIISCKSLRDSFPTVALLPINERGQTTTDDNIMSPMAIFCLASSSSIGYQSVARRLPYPPIIVDPKPFF
jgi:hypothetical protein